MNVYKPNKGFKNNSRYDDSRDFKNNIITTKADENDNKEGNYLDICESQPCINLRDQDMTMLINSCDKNNNIKNIDLSFKGEDSISIFN